MINKRLQGWTVEEPLDALLWQLVRGEVTLDGLTPALASFYHLGFHDGQGSLRGRLERLEYENNRLWLRLNNPTPERLRAWTDRQLDAFAADPRNWPELFAAVDEIARVGREERSAA